MPVFKKAWQMLQGLQKERTVCSRSRMSTREYRLRVSALSLEGLSDRLDLLSHFCVFVNLGLEVLEDDWIDHSRRWVGGHGGLLFFAEGENPIGI